MKLAFVFCIIISRYPFGFFFWNFSRIWISVLPAVKHVKPYSSTGKIRDLWNPNFTNVYTLIAKFRFKHVKTLLASFIILLYAVSTIHERPCEYQDLWQSPWFLPNLHSSICTVGPYLWISDMHTCLLPAPFYFGLLSSQLHEDHLELASSFFAQQKF